MRRERALESESFRERFLWREKETGDFKEGEAVGLRGGGRIAVGIIEKIGERGRGKRIEKLGFLNYYFIG